MAGLYPLSRMQQLDGNGRPLSGARLFLFDGGTSTPRIGFRDSSLTSPHPHPIPADAAGRLPLIYLDDGFYRHRLTSKTGTLVFDDDGIPVLSSSAGGSGTSVDPDSIFKTRDIKIRFDNQPLPGYVRLNGRTIGSAASGASERAHADTQSLYEELWPFANIGVTGGKGASASIDFSANKPLVLPNCAGRSIFGMDDMGAGAQNILTTAVVGSNPAAPGATGGAQTLTLIQQNIPSYLLLGGTGVCSGTTANENQTHAHTFAGNTAAMSANASHAHGYQPANTVNVGITYQAGGTPFSAGGPYPGAGNTGAANIEHTHPFGGTTSTENAFHNHPFAGTVSSVQISSGGSGLAVNKLPPLCTFMIYVRL